MKNKFIFAFFCVILMALPLMVCGQDLTDVYTVVDVLSTPVIGQKKLQSLINSFVKEHKDYGGNGPETIWFVVNEEGSIGEVRPPLQINESINMYKYNDEVSFVKSLKFNPATVNGNAVASWYNINIPYPGVPKRSYSGIGAIDVKGNANEGKIYQVVKNNKDTKQKVFKVVEQMPSFPGGIYYLMSYLSENIHYPVEAKKKGIQGRVVVSFVVEKDGSLSDFNVVQSVDPDLDAEALRVVKAMPKWMPGKQDGKGIRVKYNVPISFRL